MTARKRRSKKQSSEAVGKRLRVVYVIVGVAVIAAAVFVGLTVFSTDGGSELDRLTAFKKNGTLTFIDATGEVIRTVDIEIADDDSRRRVGLMYRKALTDSQAMLFISPRQEVQAFWMRNTPVSLDMIFADSAGRIVTIHRETEPYAKKQYFSDGPALYVVEVDAGFTDRYGVAVGDKIEWARTGESITSDTTTSDTTTAAPSQN